MAQGGRVNQKRPTPVEELAERLQRLDPARISRRAGVSYDLSEAAYSLPFVGRPARVWCKQCAGLWTDLDPPVPLKPLHLRIAMAYLLTADPECDPDSGWQPALVASAEACKALIAALGRDSASLIRAARKLGGRRSQVGELAVELALLPRVRLRIAFLSTDPAPGLRCRIELSRGADRHLPADMLAALVDMAVTRLIAAAQ